MKYLVSCLRGSLIGSIAGSLAHVAVMVEELKEPFVFVRCLGIFLMSMALSLPFLGAASVVIGRPIASWIATRYPAGRIPLFAICGFVLGLMGYLIVISLFRGDPLRLFQDPQYFMFELKMLFVAVCYTGVAAVATGLHINSREKAEAKQGASSLETE